MEGTMGYSKGYSKLTPIVAAILVIVPTVFFQITETPARETAADVRFRWAFGVIPSGEAERRLAPVTGDTVLRSGDRFKFFIQPETDCYIYLFYRGVRGEMALLFPYALDRFDGASRIGRAYYVPQGEDWFSLDENTGLERFYLMAATERLTELEALYREYAAAPAGEKPDLAAAMVGKIREIRRSRRSLSASAERPVSIGGNLRGSVVIEGEGYPDVAAIAEVIAEDDFFARTFTIDHR
jgi:hypothetical protein